MTPTFITKFDLATKKLIVIDTFDYYAAGIDTAFGNATIKIGNQILHTNTYFNSSADIVYGVNSSFEIDLPLNSDGTVRETGYEVTYDIRFTSNTTADVAADTFTVVTIPTNAALATLINQSIAAGVGMKATFNLGSTSGYPILSATSTTITFASITISGAGTGLNSAIVSSTSNSETTHSYNFCDTTPISDLCVESDCFYATLTASDTTPYLATQTILDRVLTINYPRLANGEPVEVAVVTNEASQTVGPAIYTGGYLVTLSTLISWTQSDGLLVFNTVAARSDYTLSCDGSICNAFNCIKAYAVKYQQAVALGSRDLAQFTQQNFQILIYCNLYNIAVECKNTSEARAILVALGEYMSASGVTVAGCDCGCGQSSTNSTEPTVVYPLYNSAVYNSATEISRGIIELATLSEASAGTDEERAITPYSLKHVLDSRRASQGQVDIGTNDIYFITPLKLQKRLLNTSNTTTGTNTAALNTINGKVTYTAGFASADPVSFVLTNSFITASSSVLWSISFTQESGEVLYPMCSTLTNGQIVFWVGIANGSETTQPVVISYTILNP
jgi:hypothetical protein